jgi:hypothetical protein
MIHVYWQYIFAPVMVPTHHHEATFPVVNREAGSFKQSLRIPVFFDINSLNESAANLFKKYSG